MSAIFLKDNKLNLDNPLDQYDVDACFNLFEESKMKYAEKEKKYSYGLKRSDLLNVRKKIKKQSDFLENNKFVTASGQIKSLLDVSFSSNLSKRYYPQILNKVDTFVSTSQNLNLVPIFLTVTLDGFFRDLLKGNFKRYKESRESYLKHIPNNDRSGYYLDYIDKENTLTPKDLYKIIGHQLHRFHMCETLRNIKKDGFTYSSIRVTEPHKDGTPHFHILMYVPKQYVLKMYYEFQKFFPAPRNHVKLEKIKKYDNSRDGIEIAEGIFETVGFQTEVRSAVGYILKYILKSFTNLINEEEIDYLQAWYVHNRIPRLITTHTLISQEVYRKTAILEEDWYYLTNIKLKGIYEQDTDNKTFKFDDEMGRKIIGDNGLVMIWNNGKIVASYGSKKNSIKVVRLRSLDFSANKWYQHLPDNAKPASFNILERYAFYVPPKPYSYYITKVFEDGTMFTIGSPTEFILQSGEESTTFNMFDEAAYFQNGDLFEEETDSLAFISVSRMKDYDLLQHYYNFDFNTHNPARYALVNNELIGRGLLQSHYKNLNDYNKDFHDL